MRGLQRDALVAYILHQMRSHPDSAHIDTPDKLFEYFLMDVADGAVHADLAHPPRALVGAAVHRALPDEPGDRASRRRPSTPKQWEWMKRYRVWEANRKVFLCPENWLEPELRDDKSPFFKEIESELLQSDITEDAAATALLNYLSKLEEVAKLEPCGIYYVARDDSQGTGEIDHVVARTAGAHRKYYYRRYEYGSWTPWEQIKLDIEDNPVIPVVWNDRLLLFWLRIIKEVADRRARHDHAADGSDGQDEAHRPGEHRRDEDRREHERQRPTACRDGTGGALLERILQRQMAADEDLRCQSSGRPRDIHPARRRTPSIASRLCALLSETATHYLRVEIQDGFVHGRQ